VKKSLGWKGYDLIWLLRDGWREDDAATINTLAAALGDPNAPMWARDAAPMALDIWAESGLPEDRYL